MSDSIIEKLKENRHIYMNLKNADLMRDLKDFMECVCHKETSSPYKFEAWAITLYFNHKRKRLEHQIRIIELLFDQKNFNRNFNKFLKECKKIKDGAEVKTTYNE